MCTCYPHVVHVPNGTVFTAVHVLGMGPPSEVLRYRKIRIVNRGASRISVGEAPLKTFQSLGLTSFGD